MAQQSDACKNKRAQAAWVGSPVYNDANELSLKLGILVSPRTVKKYWPDRQDSGPRCVSGRRWTTFVRNHANAIIACDFATVVTASFRVLYVCVVMEIGTRRILHWNITEHPIAQ